LIVVDVFSRKVYTEALESKRPQEVWENFSNILEKLDKKPSRVDSDDGSEFGPYFQERLKSNGIVGQQKQPEDINGNSVETSATKAIKEIMFREMAKDNTTSWINYVEKATNSYNSIPHGTVYNESPEDVSDEAIVKFRLLQDNAEKLARNSKQLENRQEKLEAAGGFRVMLPRSEWNRSFKPKWSGEVKKVDTIDGGFVKSGGKRYAIARVQPVAANQPSTPIPAALAAGNERRNEKNKQDLQEFVAPLKQFLKNGAQYPTAVAKTLKEKFGYDEKIKAAKISTTAFVRLFPEEFDIMGDGRVKLKTTRARVSIRL